MELHPTGEEPPIIPKPLRAKEMSQVCPDPKDAVFIDTIESKSGMQNVYDLCLAANYMEIKALVNLCCAKTASLVRGVPVDKVGQTLTKGTKLDIVETKEKEKKEHVKRKEECISKDESSSSSQPEEGYQEAETEKKKGAKKAKKKSK
jgi:S-phase kinase-associated protein 1